MLSQIIILITSITAVLLTQQPWKPSLAKYAPIIGLVGQPAWLIATHEAGQGGMFIVSCVYTAVWVLGIYKYWVIERQSVIEK